MPPNIPSAFPKFIKNLKNPIYLRACNNDDEWRHRVWAAGQYSVSESCIIALVAIAGIIPINLHIACFCDCEQSAGWVFA